MVKDEGPSLASNSLYLGVSKTSFTLSVRDRILYVYT